MEFPTHRIAAPALAVLAVAAFLVAPAAGLHAQQSSTQRRPGNPTAPAAAPAPPAATPRGPAAAPAPAPAAVALPDPPIPTQHITQAGIPQCVAAVDQLSRAALSSPYNAQSMWNQAAPTQHVFQSVAGIKNAKNVPPSGMVAVIAAPVANEKCDAVAVEVYPLAGSCNDVQKMMAKGGEVETSLEDIKVINDVQKRRLFLMPGFGNTCVAVSVNSFFGN